jgi:hypothetical protein
VDDHRDTENLRGGCHGEPGRPGRSLVALGCEPLQRPRAPVGREGVVDPRNREVAEVSGKRAKRVRRQADEWLRRLAALGAVDTLGGGGRAQRSLDRGTGVGDSLTGRPDLGGRIPRAGPHGRDSARDGDVSRAPGAGGVPYVEVCLSGCCDLYPAGPYTPTRGGGLDRV